MKTKIFSILFLGAGKRVSLLKSFIQAGKELNLDLKIFSYEIDSFQPISDMAKVIVGEKWTSSKINNSINKIIEENKIDLLISNTDPATLCHASLKNHSKAANYISSFETVKKCLHKDIFQSFCETKKLPIIPKAQNEEYPCFAKPCIGSASKGVRLILTKDEKLAFLENKSNKFLFQRYIKGDEYTVDAFISNSMKECIISPRIRLATSGGEAVITQTIKHPKIESISKRVIETFGLIGPITIQFLEDADTKKIFLMEVNPRLGGGVLASIKSGYNIPKFMLQDTLGLKIDLNIKKREFLMKRYFMEKYYEINH